MDVALEYGDTQLSITLPDSAEILRMRREAPLEDPAATIEEALSDPLGAATLREQVRSLTRTGVPLSELTAAITISDHTRPVPYAAGRPDGILMPLLRRLRAAGVLQQNITIIVGTGTHVPTSASWKRQALGAEIADHYRIVDHDCTAADLRSIGEVDGVEVRVNREFMEAHLRIATSLAEPHFMAGVSGGGKAVSPGLMNLEATRVFHSAGWMADPRATSLNVTDNPCFQFPRKVAGRVGVHFSVNCIVNREGALTGLTAGALEPAHDAAVQLVQAVTRVVCDHEYEVVITPGGKVAVNHYQAAKAAYGTVPIVATGGTVVLAAANVDAEPVGKPEYRELMRMLASSGADAFSQRIRSPDWEFVPDQWQVQKWAQFFRKVGGFDRLIYCTTGVPAAELAWLPGRSGYEIAHANAGSEASDGPAAGSTPAGGSTPGPDPAAAVQMVQAAVDTAIAEQRRRLGREPGIAVVADGPYCVPSRGRG